jgi:lysophospholipase L1-like esterase
MPGSGYFLKWFCYLAWSMIGGSGFDAALSTNITTPDTLKTPQFYGDTINLDQYPFLSPTANALINDSSLTSFFTKLELLEHGQIPRLNIVHIGDSHVQADWWTGFMRQRLQQHFGSAGRGLVFPFQLADTNSPTDIRSSSNQSWEHRRSTFRNTHIPLGIAGMSIQTRGSQVWLDLEIKNDSLIDYSFDKVGLFGQSGPDFLNWQVGTFARADQVKMAPPPKRYHTVRNGDTLYGLALKYGTRVNSIQRWNNLRGTMIKPGQKLVVGSGGQSIQTYDQQQFEVWDSVIWEGSLIKSQQAVLHLQEPGKRVLLRASKRNGNAGLARCYGLTLENSRAQGILYHAIGVNGVTYYHYNIAEEFWEQLPYLAPDLVIVSLGTNESVVGTFREQEFATEVKRFLDKMEGTLGRIPVILTTPADALKSRRYDNPVILKIKDILLETAAEKDLAVWDLNGAMGGPGAIKEWRAHQLAARDYLHFTKAGYSLQGELLFRALMRAYAQR